MGFKIHFCRLATVAKPNRCSSDRFPTPFVFFPRWKYKKINTGLSHHLLVHCGKVRQPAGDFDYFLLPCQTQPSIRSYHNFFFLFFSILLPSLLLTPAVRVVPVSFGGSQLTRFGLLWSVPSLHRFCLLYLHRHSPGAGQIKTHGDNPEVTIWTRVQRLKGAGQEPAQLCVCEIRIILRHI